mmetsp:Transcript_42670/g.79952  ORF Transcript_42670/g.79952 Transcript_42670/m.79952 type:complete len:1109 (-) Transcript_42670:312-3638(-)
MDSALSTRGLTLHGVREERQSSLDNQGAFSMAHTLEESMNTRESYCVNSDPPPRNSRPAERRRSPSFLERLLCFQPVPEEGDSDMEADALAKPSRDPSINRQPDQVSRIPESLIEDKKDIDMIKQMVSMGRSAPSFMSNNKHVYFNDTMLKDVMAVITVGNESGWQALFNYVHQLCPRVLNCDSCMLYLCTTEMEEIVTLSTDGAEKRTPCTDDSVARVVFDNMSVNLNKNSSEEEKETWSAPSDDTDWCILVVPVSVDKSQMVGALRVLVPAGNDFTDYDRRAARALADLLGMAVSNVIQAERDSYMIEKSEALPVTSRRLLSVMGIRPLFEVVRQELKQLLGFESVHMYLFDKARGDLWTETVYGRVMWPLTGSSILNEVFKTCAPMLLHADEIARATALDKDEWNILEDMEVDTMAVVPIMHPLMANAPFGVLQVCNKSPDLVSLLGNATIKDEDIRVLEAMSLHVASAVHATQMLQNFTQSHSTEVYANNTSVGQTLASIHTARSVQTPKLGSMNSFDTRSDHASEPHATRYQRRNRASVASYRSHRLSHQTGAGPAVPAVAPQLRSFLSMQSSSNATTSDERRSTFSSATEHSGPDRPWAAVGSAAPRITRSRLSMREAEEASRTGVPRSTRQSETSGSTPSGGTGGDGAATSRVSVVYHHHPLDAMATLARGAFVDEPEPIDDKQVIVMDVPAVEAFLGDGDIQASDILDPDLDLLRFSKAQLDDIVLAMFIGLRFDVSLGLPRSLMMTLIREIQVTYKDNPFHNWAHAVTVTHTTFITIIGIPDIGDYLKLLDVMAVLFAGLAHDMYHTGQNNSFHVQSMSTYAIRYNDKSVLEQHSAAAFFELFAEKHPMKSFMTPTEFMQTRQIILNCILDTDLSSHEVSLNLFTSHLTFPFNRDLLDDRKNICSILLHAADLSNPTRKFSQAFEWASRLGDEFLAQAALERTMGLNVAPFMEKVKEKESMAKNEIYFIKAFVEPLWVNISKLFPSVSPRVNTLHCNLRVYQKMIEPDVGRLMPMSANRPTSPTLSMEKDGPRRSTVMMLAHNSNRKTDDGNGEGSSSAAGGVSLRKSIDITEGVILNKRRASLDTSAGSKWNSMTITH